VSATVRAAAPTVLCVTRPSVLRSGKVFAREASSSCSSIQRASAPRRAQVRMSVECLAIPAMLRRTPNVAQYRLSVHREIDLLCLSRITEFRVPLAAPLRCEIEKVVDGRQQIDSTLLDVLAHPGVCRVDVMKSAVAIA